MTESAFWIVTGVLAFAVLALLTVATVVDWPSVRRPWRPVLILAIAQQAVIAYGCGEAYREHVEVASRVYLIAATLVGLLIVLGLLILDVGRHGRVRDRARRRA